MTSFKDSKFVKHESCPRCQSSDALARYSDGHAHCFAVGCGYRESSKGEVMTEAEPAVTI